ncbi:MAG TPA: signal recognition particle-docking protein FtsY [Candidatus Nanopelagicaceae bacterium]|nr:signal recognition particle-docking protein FtsY [Candidatus Nanopelagicaceae bacterium]
MKLKAQVLNRLFGKRERLERSQGFGRRFASIFKSGRLDPEQWQELEEILLNADVGLSLTTELLTALRHDLAQGEDPLVALKRELMTLLETETSREITFTRHEDGSPQVILVVGVNGTGKTTTTGKLANLAQTEGAKVFLAAADTFRAAASEQLETWATRAKATLVRGNDGADSASVAFDGLREARAANADLLIVDTAGRLHTKVDLMNELGKVKRVIEKSAKVDEVLLVLDATTGQNGIAQAKIFAEAVAVTGLVLTKLDGTARGGVVLAVQRELGIPVKLVGVGEGIDDLVEFDPEIFIDGLIASS